MMFKNFAIIGVLVLVSLIGGCQDDVKTPDPMELTRDAIGHYCNMIVVDHTGPKAQVFETGAEQTAVVYLGARCHSLYDASRRSTEGNLRSTFTTWARQPIGIPPNQMAASGLTPPRHST